MPIMTFTDGDELLTFTRTPHPAPPAHDADIPVTWCIVVLMCQGKYVLLYNTYRQEWEIPAGRIEPGEYPDDCARREAKEETSQIINDMTCFAVMKIRVYPEARYEYGVMYIAAIDELLPFVENAESSTIILWDYGQPLEGKFDEFARYLIAMTRK